MDSIGTAFGSGVLCGYARSKYGDFGGAGREDFMFDPGGGGECDAQRQSLAGGGEFGRAYAADCDAGREEEPTGSELAGSNKLPNQVVSDNDGLAGYA